MDGAPAKAKGRRRPPKKAEGGAAAAAGGGAAAVPAAARTATEATATEQTEHDEAAQPQPTLSQRLAKSLKQLSQLGAGSKTEDGDEVEQDLLRGQAREPAPAQAGQGEEEEQQPPPHELGGAEEEGEGGGPPASRLRRFGRRLSALLPRGKLHPTAALGARRPAAGAAAALLLLLLGGGLLAARQARVHRSQLAELQERFASQHAAAAASQHQVQRQVAAVERSVQQLGARLAASAGELAAVEHTCGTQAAAASDLRAQLAAARDDIAQLQLGAAAAVAAVQAGNASEAAAAAAAGGQRVRQLVQEEVAAALETFAADRTGLPDYALAAAGGAVVAHSPAHLPPGVGPGAGGALGSLYSRLQAGGVHPQASKVLLAPLSQPGACLPLVGATGWVDIRLAQPIRPTAWTYEHIPSSIAHDLRSAPRHLSLVGFLGRPPAPPATGAATQASALAGGGGASEPGARDCAGCGAAAAAGEANGTPQPSTPQPASSAAALAAGGVLLGEWHYDVRSRHAVQTFQLSPAALPPGGAIDHVRLAVRSNWGHPGFTCLYRVRVHGTPAVAVPAAAAAAPPPPGDPTGAPTPSPANRQPPPLYASAAGEAKLRRLYDSTLAALPFAHEERWVDCPSFGRAHVTVCGPPDAPPLVVWHGTAAPGPFMLQTFPRLVQRFRVYCPDIPGQAGSRSELAIPDPEAHGYASWCTEVLEGLGLLAGPDAQPPLHVGVSLGGAVLLDLAVSRPEAVRAAVLVVPGSLHPSSAKPWMPWSVALGFAAHRYLPCAPTAWLALRAMCDEPLGRDPVKENVLLAIRYCNYFPGIPRYFSDEQLRRLAMPILVVAAEHDVFMFWNGQGAVDRARAVWPHADMLLLRGARHLASDRRWEEATERMLRFFNERAPAGAG